MSTGPHWTEHLLGTLEVAGVEARRSHVADEFVVGAGLDVIIAVSAPRGPVLLSGTSRRWLFPVLRALLALEEARAVGEDL